jgi:mycothiol synthase
MVNTLPDGLTMRPSSMDDLEIVYDLLHAYDLVQYGEEDFTLEDLRTSWTSPDFNFARDERLVFDQTGQLIANLHLGQQKHTKFFAYIHQRPGYGDQRIGSYLLDLAETWTRERLVLAEPDARITLSCWVASTDQGMQQLYERANFRDIRHHWRMEIEFSEVPVSPDWPKGITLRPFVSERDARAVFDVDNTVFQDHWGFVAHDFENWKHWEVERSDFDPSLWFVAYEGDQPVGISLCHDVDGRYGWVNTLGVLRPWRRSGLGLALLLHSFGEFYRRGRRRAGLGVDSQNLTGATRLYQRAGMYKARESITYEKELRSGIELSTQSLTV